MVEWKSDIYYHYPNVNCQGFTENSRNVRTVSTALCFDTSGYYYLFDDNQLITQVVVRQPSMACLEVTAIGMRQQSRHRNSFSS